MDNADEKREERRLRRINSWKEDPAVSDQQIQEMDSFFHEPMSIPSDSRRRSSSMDSVCSDYSDVYEIKDESMLFDEEDAPKTPPAHHFEDCMSYNPYIRSDSHRGGGQPLFYKLTGVIHHIGSGCGGHYICFRKVKINRKETWVMFNDVYVQEVKWSDVNNSNV